MPKELNRYYGQGHFHFLTFSCYRRLPLLGRAWARTAFVKALAAMRDRYGFLLVGYVVMPESCSPADQRGAEIYAIIGSEGVETARIAGFAKAETACADETNAAGI
jgi:hypothetical protein